MSSLLFSLRGVPDDEADEIRILLNENDIDYYETSAGNWGISMPALWVIDEQTLCSAQQLLNEYHRLRASHQRKIAQQLKKEGKQYSFLKSLIKKPFRFILYIATIIFIVYIYIRMLFELGL